MTRCLQYIYARKGGKKQLSTTMKKGHINCEMRQDGDKAFEREEMLGVQLEGWSIRRA